MGPDDLDRRLTEAPFQPFRVRLSTNSTIDVHHPGEIVHGETSAIFPLEVVIDTDGFRLIKTWRTIALSHIVEFVDIDAKRNGAKRSRK